MHRIFVALIVISSSAVLTQCASEHTRTERELEVLLPPVPSSFSKADSVRLIRNWTIGMKLFKSGCSKCHGVFGKGKDSIPNFSKEQYDEYQTAFLAGDSSNHAVISKMTDEELRDVFLFMTDLKRSN